MGTEQIPPRDVRHGDVIQDLQSGQWLTVTRLVNGPLEVSESDEHTTVETWTFYGDGRLDEQITIAGDATVARKTSG